MANPNLCKVPNPKTGGPQEHLWKGTHAPHSLDPVEYRCGNCEAEGAFSPTAGMVLPVTGKDAKGK
jgi:hypothetical protein